MKKKVIKQTMACLLGTALVITQPGLYPEADAAASVSSITNGGFENGTEG